MSVSKKTSPEAAIRSALSAHNPFERPPVVKEQNIWDASFPDIPSVNAEASDSVFDAIQKVSAADASSEKVTSIVFTAEHGVGKSHVIKRIRKRLQASGEGLFIYASGDRYGDLSLVNATFQQFVAESLEQQGSAGVNQWQEVATLMVAEALRANRSGAKAPAAKDLVAKFDQAYQKNHAKGKDLVTDLTKVIRRLKPGIDPYILRAIVWTLSEERGSLAVKWLAGEQLEAQDAIDLRLPPNNKTNAEIEASAPTVIAKIISFLSEYKTVIICFDELDTNTFDAEGFSAAFSILTLVKRLFDSVNQSSNAKGVITLTVVIPNVWRQFRQSKIAATDKISSYGAPIDLEYLKPAAVLELCAITLKKFYAKQGLVPPNPIYPFEESKIVAFGEGRPSARESLKWLATVLNDILKDQAEPSISPTERFNKAYQNALARFDPEDLDSNEQVAAALRFGFERIISIDKLREQPIEGVILKAVEDITPKSKNSGWLNFRVVGEENGEAVAIGLGVVQNTHGRAVAAGFRRLLDTKTFELSRGCLVRSRARKIKRNWDSFEYYQQLVESGGEWVDLLVDEIKPLIALQYVYEHCDKFDLTIKRLDSFAFTRKLLQNSPLLREILSRPEGAIAPDAVEGDERQRLNTDINPNLGETDLLQSLAVDDSSPDSAEALPDLQDIEDLVVA